MFCFCFRKFGFFRISDSNHLTGYRSSKCTLFIFGSQGKKAIVCLMFEFFRLKISPFSLDK